MEVAASKSYEELALRRQHLQLKAHLGNGPTSVPTPASGAFPGFTVTVTQAG